MCTSGSFIKEKWNTRERKSERFHVFMTSMIRSERIWVMSEESIIGLVATGRK